MNYTKAELYEKFENLPDDVREAFLSIDTYNTVKKIVDKYKLHVDQSGLLSEEIGFVMLGVSRPENFLTSLQQRLNISTEITGEIVKDINIKIFFPIRSSLETLSSGRVDKYKTEYAPLVENFSPAGQISEQTISKPQIPLQNNNNNAIINSEGIEKPEELSDRQIFDEKMGKLFRIPKEEIELGSINQPAVEQSDIPKSTDPYREIPK